MLEHLIEQPIFSFTPAVERDRRIRACPGADVVGQSESGRGIVGIVVGQGEHLVSLIAGSHSDEPVGSETLMYLAEYLTGDAAQAAELRQAYRFVIVPHVNPDGETLNRAWIDEWPDPLAYLQHRVREPPGRDVEFAWPNRRPENVALARLLADHGPFDLHLSLHGMAMATGGWHLIERHGVDRTAELRRQYAAAMSDVGLELFDWDRGGDKGFEYIEPGFATTPRGAAMREHFLAEGDTETAALFGDSSMEYVRSLGGDPLCMVTELPLFVLRGGTIDDEPGKPHRYFAFKERLDQAGDAIVGDDIDRLADLMGDYALEAMPIDRAVRLQLRAIALGLEAICP